MGIGVGPVSGNRGTAWGPVSGNSLVFWLTDNV